MKFLSVIYKCIVQIMYTNSGRLALHDLVPFGCQGVNFISEIIFYPFVVFCTQTRTPLSSISSFIAQSTFYGLYMTWHPYLEVAVVKIVAAMLRLKISVCMFSVPLWNANVHCSPQRIRAWLITSEDAILKIIIYIKKDNSVVEKKKL